MGKYMDKLSGFIISIFAFLITFTAVFWSSGAPLWFDWRVYPEQILLVALALAMAVAFLTRSGSLQSLSIILAILSLIFGSWLAVRFPVLSENVFYHPTEALLVSLLGLVLILEAVRRTMGWSLIVILGLVCLYALFSSNFSGPLQSRSISPDRLLKFLVLDSASLAGAALTIAVAVVVPFLILAQLLLATGGAKFFSDFSLALAGRKRGCGEDCYSWFGIFWLSVRKRCLKCGLNRCDYDPDDERWRIPEGNSWSYRGSSIYRWTTHAANHGCSGLSPS